MNTFAERLRYYMQQANMKQIELVEKTKINKSSISEYLSGSYEPKQRNIYKIAMALGIKPSQLMGIEEDRTTTPPPLPQFDNIHQVAPVKIPILGRIACGEPIFEAEDFQGYTDFISKIHVDFCLIAQGDSMIGARIHDGDVVFIRQQPEVENGEIAAVSINDEVTLKRIYIYDNQIVLNAENPKYAPMIYSLDQIESFRILGKAVAFQSKIV